MKVLDMTGLKLSALSQIKVFLSTLACFLCLLFQVKSWFFMTTILVAVRYIQLNLPLTVASQTLRVVCKSLTKCELQLC